MTINQVEVHTAVATPTGIPLAVFGWPGDLNACGHYRVVQPLKALARKHQVQTEIGTGSSLPYTLLIAQRSQEQEPVDFLEYVKGVRRGGVPKLIYELDDDLWSIEEHNPAYSNYQNPSRIARIEKAIRLADAVTVSTYPLAQVIISRGLNENVFVLPNSISERYLNELQYPYRTGAPGKPFVLGWCGSSTHENDFKMCVSSINTLLKFDPNTRMVFFGTSYSHLLDPAVRGQCRTAAWTKSVHEYMELLSLAQIDVMLAPLHPSTFNESKSNLRILEANALGIPVVATDFGPYDSLGGSPGVITVPAGNSWLPALSELSSHPMIRLEMSTAGRDWVRKWNLQENTVDLWLESYLEILEASDPPGTKGGSGTELVSRPEAS